MQKSRLWQQLLLLERPEYLRFTKWLDSPYHNQREDLRGFWKLLRQHLDAGSIANSEELWAGLFPSENINRTDFHRLCSRMSQQLEAYFIDQFRQQEPISPHLTLIRAYQQRKSYHLAHLVQKRAQRCQDKRIIQNETWYRDQFFLDQLAYNAQSLSRDRTYNGLYEMSGSLDAHFVLSKISHACSEVAARRIASAEKSLELLPEVLELVESGRFADHPVIEIYYAAYRMLADQEGQDWFHRLRERLREYASILPVPELRSVYLLAINFAIRQVNQGVPRALENIYELYHEGLDKGWLYESGTLSPWTFKNIVACGLKLEDFNGISQFIETQSIHLPEDVRDNHIRYNRAELQFAQGAFSKCLQQLASTHFRDPLTELRARILQIKAAFEIESMDLVGYQLDNLRKFLSRKQKLTYHKDFYRNFERFARRLMVLTPQDPQRNQLKTEVREEPDLVERKWLLNKI